MHLPAATLQPVHTWQLLRRPSEVIHQIRPVLLLLLLRASCSSTAQRAQLFHPLAASLSHSLGDHWKVWAALGYAWRISRSWVTRMRSGRMCKAGGPSSVSASACRCDAKSSLPPSHPEKKTLPDRLSFLLFIHGKDVTQPSLPSSFSRGVGLSDFHFRSLVQCLFESSEETPGVKGLGVIPGTVSKFTDKSLRSNHLHKHALPSPSPASPSSFVICHSLRIF